MRYPKTPAQYTLTKHADARWGAGIGAGVGALAGLASTNSDTSGWERAARMAAGAGLGGAAGYGVGHAVGARPAHAPAALPSAATHPADVANVATGHQPPPQVQTQVQTQVREPVQTQVREPVQTQAHEPVQTQVREPVQTQVREPVQTPEDEAARKARMAAMLSELTQAKNEAKGTGNASPNKAMWAQAGASAENPFHAMSAKTAPSGQRLGISEAPATYDSMAMSQPGAVAPRSAPRGRGAARPSAQTQPEAVADLARGGPVDQRAELEARKATRQTNAAGQRGAPQVPEAALADAALGKGPTPPAGGTAPQGPYYADAQAWKSDGLQEALHPRAEQAFNTGLIPNTQRGHNEALQFLGANPASHAEMLAEYQPGEWQHNLLTQLGPNGAPVQGKPSAQAQPALNDPRLTPEQNALRARHARRGQPPPQLPVQPEVQPHVPPQVPPQSQDANMADIALGNAEPPEAVASPQRAEQQAALQARQAKRREPQPQPQQPPPEAAPQSPEAQLADIGLGRAEPPPPSEDPLAGLRASDAAGAASAARRQRMEALIAKKRGQVAGAEPDVFAGLSAADSANDAKAKQLEDLRAAYAKREAARAAQGPQVQPQAALEAPQQPQQPQQQQQQTSQAYQRDYMARQRAAMEARRAGKTFTASLKEAALHATLAAYGLDKFADARWGAGIGAGLGALGGLATTDRDSSGWDIAGRMAAGAGLGGGIGYGAGHLMGVRPSKAVAAGGGGGGGAPAPQKAEAAMADVALGKTAPAAQKAEAAIADVALNKAPHVEPAPQKAEAALADVALGKTEPPAFTPKYKSNQDYLVAKNVPPELHAEYLADHKRMGIPDAHTPEFQEFLDLEPLFSSRETLLPWLKQPQTSGTWKENLRNTMHGEITNQLRAKLVAQGIENPSKDQLERALAGALDSMG